MEYKSNAKSEFSADIKDERADLTDLAPGEPKTATFSVTSSKEWNGREIDDYSTSKASDGGAAHDSSPSSANLTPHRPSLGELRPHVRQQHKQLSPTDKARQSLLAPVHDLSPQKLSPSSLQQLQPISPSSHTPLSHSPHGSGNKLASLKSSSTSPSASFSFGSGSGKLDAPPLGEIVTPQGKSSAGLKTLHAEGDTTPSTEHSPLSLPRPAAAVGLRSPSQLSPLGGHRKTLAPLRSASQDQQDAPVGAAVTDPERAMHLPGELDHSIGLNNRNNEEPAAPVTQAAAAGEEHSVPGASTPSPAEEIAVSSAEGQEESVASGQEDITFTLEEPGENSGRSAVVDGDGPTEDDSSPGNAQVAASLGQAAEVIGGATTPAATSAGHSSNPAEDGESAYTPAGEGQTEAQAVSSDTTALENGANPETIDAGTTNPSSQPDDAGTREGAGSNPAVSLALQALQPEEAAFQPPPPNTPLRGAAASIRSSSTTTSSSSTDHRIPVLVRSVGPLAIPKEATETQSSPRGSALSSPRSVHGNSTGATAATLSTPSQRVLTTASSVASGLTYSTTPTTPSLKGRMASHLTAASTVTHNTARRGDRTPQQPLAAQQYELRYNRAASELRQALLRLDTDMSNSKSIVRNIFRQLNVSEHADLTVQELKSFVLSPELALFEANDPRALKYATLLMEQIDINGDGSVSLSELETFLFPPRMGQEGHQSGQGGDVKEIGVVIDFTRTAVRYHVSSAAAMGSDEAILAEFAKLAKTTLKRGVLDTQLIKKAFLNIKIPEFGRYLNKGEVDALVATIDCNDDGVVSANEFKNWLFPSHRQGDQAQLAQYLRKILNDHYDGDLWAMYRDFCNGSEQMYKNDFVVVLKTLDSAISRHEALAMANKIAGTDKMITMAHLQTAIGISNRAMQSAAASETASVAFSAVSTEADASSSTFMSPRSKRRQRREKTASGGKSNLPTHQEGIIEGGDAEPLEDGGDTHRTPRRSRPRGGGIGGGVSLFDSVGDGPSTPHAVSATAAVEGELSPGPDPDQESDGEFSAEHVSEASDLSFDSEGEEEEGGEGEGSGGRVLGGAGVRQGGPASPAKLSNDPGAPTQREKDAVRELLQQAHAAAQLGASTTLSASMVSTGSDVRGLDALPTGSSPRKTVGLAAEQLRGLGYAEHTGRWRGFPYDSWSCCDTKEMHCPRPGGGSPNGRARQADGGSAHNSPSKLRSSLGSTGDGSLYSAPKIVPFIPAGTASPRALTNTRASEIRPHTSPPARSHSPSPTKSTTAAARRLHPRTPSPAKPAPMKATSTGVRTAAQHGALTANRTAPSRPSSTAQVARPAPARQPSSAARTASTTRPVLSKPIRSGTTDRGASSVSVRSVTVHSVKISTVAPKKTSFVNNSVSNVASAAHTTTVTSAPAATTAEPDIKAADNQAVLTAPTAAELVDAAVAQHSLEQTTAAVGPATDSPVAVPAHATQDSTVSLPSQEEASEAPAPAAAPIPEPPAPPGSTTPTVKVLAAASSETSPPKQKFGESMASPPIKTTFTVRVPPAPAAETLVPPDSSELFNRLYAPAPVVEAQRAKLIPYSVYRGRCDPSRQESDDAPQLEESAEDSRLALRASQELRDLLGNADTTWDTEAEVSQNTSAFNQTLQSLRAELGATEPSEEQQKGRDVVRTVSEEPNKSKAKSGSLQVTAERAALVDALPSFSGYHGLEVTGSASFRYGSPSASAIQPSSSFHVDPLEALFPAQRARSPRHFQTRRSHSAPAASRLSHGSRYMNSNSDSFFGAGVPKWRSFTPLPKRPPNKSTKQATHTATARPPSPSPQARARKTAVWLPSSPLHATSFYRIRHWRPKASSPIHGGVTKAAIPIAAGLPPRRAAVVPARRARSQSPTAASRQGVPHTGADPGYRAMPSDSQVSPEAKHSEGSPASPVFSYGALPAQLNPHHAIYHTLFEPSVASHPTHVPIPPQLPMSTHQPPLLSTPPHLGHVQSVVAPSPILYPSYASSVPYSPGFGSVGYPGYGFTTLPSSALSQPMAYLPVTIPTYTAGYAPYPISLDAVGSAAPIIADTQAWWEHIQAQKRQHEVMAYEAALQQRTQT